MKSIELITAERKRQIEKEGWTPEHDVSHANIALAVAGAAYVLGVAKIHTGETASWKPHFNRYSKAIWPFDLKWWKPTPKDPIRQLVKAAALIAAEIDKQLLNKKEEEAK